MNYQNLPNKDSEILSLEDEQVRQLIGDLKRIDAPKDFNFRLKGRIAKTKSSDFNPRFLPTLRYVLPLVAILVISGFVVLNGLYFPDSQAVSQVAESVPQPNIEQAIPPIMPPAIGQVANVSNPAKDEKLFAADSPTKPEPAKTAKEVKSSANETQFVAVKSRSTLPKKKLNVEEKKDDNGGGSRDSASSVSPIITPKGINLNTTPENPSNPENKQPLNTQEVLSQLGIEANFTNPGWMVKSVKQHSLAESSGVKVGDVVEAIDGEKLSDKLLNVKTIQVKKITILRGSEKIEISLRVNK